MARATPSLPRPLASQDQIAIARGAQQTFGDEVPGLAGGTRAQDRIPSLQALHRAGDPVGDAQVVPATVPLCSRPVFLQGDQRFGNRRDVGIDPPTGAQAILGETGAARRGQLLENDALQDPIATGKIC